MHLTDQHKALLITFLISGTVILFVFNLSLIQKDDISSESYYEIESEKELTEEEIDVLDNLEKLSNSKAETNNAFNESQENKHFAQAFEKIAPPEDYVPKPSNEGSESGSLPDKRYDSTESKLNEDELSKFNKLNDLLKEKRSENNNAKSSISFSLKNRKKLDIPIPVYLCEVDGKIVINIQVNSAGDVTNTYVNSSSSTSDNECLIEHAIEYAKQSRFSPDYSREVQPGTITFFFIGKR